MCNNYNISLLDNNISNILALLEVDLLEVVL